MFKPPATPVFYQRTNTEALEGGSQYPIMLKKTSHIPKRYGKYPYHSERIVSPYP